MDSWATPDWLMNIFGDWFDPCPFNEKPDFDGLELEWKDKTYVNPPYSKPLKWVKKAIEENKKGKTIVMLLHVDTSTNWYLELVNAGARFLFIHGRLKYVNKDYKNMPSPKPSMLVILSKKDVEVAKEEKCQTE